MVGGGGHKGEFLDRVPRRRPFSPPSGSRFVLKGKKNVTDWPTGRAIDESVGRRIAKKEVENFRSKKSKKWGQKGRFFLVNSVSNTKDFITSKLGSISTS